MNAIIDNFALAMPAAGASSVLMWVVGLILKKLKATPGLRPRVALYALLSLCSFLRWRFSIRRGRCLRPAD